MSEQTVEKISCHLCHVITVIAGFIKLTATTVTATIAATVKHYNYPAPDRRTGYCFRSISLFLSLFLCQQGYEKRLDRFACNFQGRCGVTMGPPDYILGQFG